MHSVGDRYFSFREISNYACAYTFGKLVADAYYFYFSCRIYIGDETGYFCRPYIKYGYAAITAFLQRIL